MGYRHFFLEILWVFSITQRQHLAHDEFVCDDAAKGVCKERDHATTVVEARMAFHKQLIGPIHRRTHSVNELL